MALRDDTDGVRRTVRAGGAARLLEREQSRRSSSSLTNHVLKEVREASQQTASYSDPTLPLHPRLIESVTTFIGR
jgi:hypothetical protein